MKEMNMSTNTVNTEKGSAGDAVSRLSRRHFLAAASLTAATAWLAPIRLAAEQESGGIVGLIRREAATADITVTPLRRNIHVLMGSGGNIAVLTGPDGKTLVDAGIPASRPRITETLARLSADPIKHLINTHWHFDHTDGNQWLHEAGATIIAHENTRKRMSTRQRVEGWNHTFPPSRVEALPTEVFTSEKTLSLSDTTLLLKYYGPAHTDTDISVHFAEADILHVADTWWNGYYPFIDSSTGGSISGMIRATEANLARITNRTILIPGHGPIGRKSDLLEYRDMLVRIRDRVSML
jgi:glyoxylase-like metal-dependent hydrolase (beta-lactamase superfamily II)